MEEFHARLSVNPTWQCYYTNIQPNYRPFAWLKIQHSIHMGVYPISRHPRYNIQQDDRRFGNKPRTHRCYSVGIGQGTNIALEVVSKELLEEPLAVGLDLELENLWEGKTMMGRM